MNWKRERDGLVVVVGIVVVGGIVAGVGGASRFLSTLVATFLGVLLALQVDGLTDTGPAASATGTATEADGGASADRTRSAEPSGTAAAGGDAAADAPDVRADDDADDTVDGRDRTGTPDRE